MNRHRTTHAVLAVIAVLLAAHLLVRLDGQEAQAQHVPPSDLHSAAPTVVGGAVSSGVASGGDRLYQFWSDGRVDMSVRIYVDDTCEINAASSTCGPVVIIDPGP